MTRAGDFAPLLLASSALAVIGLERHHRNPRATLVLGLLAGVVSGVLIHLLEG